MIVAIDFKDPNDVYQAIKLLNTNGIRCEEQKIEVKPTSKKIEVSDQVN
jgi:hypothetical protein